MGSNPAFYSICLWGFRMCYQCYGNWLNRWFLLTEIYYWKWSYVLCSKDFNFPWYSNVWFLLTILPNLFQNRKGNRGMYVCISNLITLRVRVNLQSTDQPPPCEISPLVRSHLWSGCNGRHHSCSNLSAFWSHEGQGTWSLPQGPCSRDAVLSNRVSSERRHCKALSAHES